MQPVALIRTLAGARPRASSIRSGKFWVTQVMVVATIAAIYAIHIAVDRPADGAASGPGVSTAQQAVFALSLVPALYAALVFGLEGAVLTTLWLALLAAPLLLSSFGGDSRAFAQLLIFLGVMATGTILALRVEAERVARERAESLSRRIALLHELCLSLARAAPLPDLLDGFVRILRDGMDLEYVSVSYRGDPESPPLAISSGDPEFASYLHEHEQTDAHPTELRAFVTPLTASERSFGVLGVVSQSTTPLTLQEREIVTIAALEASQALELRELHDRRREALTLYARRVTNAQEEERARIARELHDGVVQVLSGLVRAIDLVRQQWGTKDDRLNAELEKLRSMSSEALVELRRVMRDLRPLTLDRLGLAAAIRSLAADLERTGIVVGLHFGEPRALSSEVELSMFRVVQEALTNVQKHAGASRVDIRLTIDERVACVDISDDGKGGLAEVDTSRLARKGRFGLLGMSERAALLGGDVEIISEPTGTRVVLRIPTRLDEPGLPLASLSEPARPR